jgi:prevent-host-death family protein
MKPSEDIKPISYLKAHASELIKEVYNNQGTVVITQNGEAKVILQDVKVYEQTQDSIALLKIVALSAKNMKEGRTKSAKKTFSDLHKRIEKSNL